jgi:hypothetical protein
MGGCHKHGVAWFSKYDNDPEVFCQDCKDGKPPYCDRYSESESKMEKILEALQRIEAGQCTCERG